VQSKKGDKQKEVGSRSYGFCRNEFALGVSQMQNNRHTPNLQAIETKI
jgi:hypothetical protein